MNPVQAQDNNSKKLDQASNLDDDAIITKLAKASKLDYDRLRKSIAKELGIQVKTLDEAVRQERSRVIAANKAANENLLFKEIEPWYEPVAIHDLILELMMVFDRFAILPRHSDITLALWVCFSWCVDAANTAPILAISSPEKRCGKTTVLSLLNLLVKRSLPASNITPAALFRAIEEFKPTLLIDEADTFLKQSDDLRGILNSGHTGSTAYVLRTVGDDHTPKAFNTWGAKAIALIGKLPDTLHDRSIVIPLKRKLTHEKTERLYRTNYNFEIIRRKLARFAEDNIELIKHTIVKSPDSISDRAADNWETLLAIAKLAGEQMEARAISAIIALSSTEEPRSYGIALLTDIKEVFETNDVDRIFSNDLVSQLCSDSEKPWATLRLGNPIDQRVLANLLKEFSIESKSIRIGSRNLKGYELEQFEDIFSRYIPILPILSVTASQTNITNDCSDILVSSQSVTKTLSVTPNTFITNVCDAVTDKNPENRGMRENSENNSDNSDFEDTDFSQDRNIDYDSGYTDINYNPDQDEIDDYLLEERAAIMEYDGGLTKKEAEIAVWGKVVSKGSEAIH